MLDIVKDDPFALFRDRGRLQPFAIPSCPNVRCSLVIEH
jgi:hypothetical protein